MSPITSASKSPMLARATTPRSFSSPASSGLKSVSSRPPSVSERSLSETYTTSVPCRSAAARMPSSSPSESSGSPGM